MLPSKAGSSDIDSDIIVSSLKMLPGRCGQACAKLPSLYCGPVSEYHEAYGDVFSIGSFRWERVEAQQSNGVCRTPSA